MLRHYAKTATKDIEKHICAKILKLILLYSPPFVYIFGPNSKHYVLIGVTKYRTFLLEK